MFVWFLLGAVFMFRMGLPVAELSDFIKKPNGRSGEAGKFDISGRSSFHLANEKERAKVAVESYVVRDGKIVKLDETRSLEGGVLVNAEDCFLRPKRYFLRQARELMARSSPFEDDTIASQALISGVLNSGELLENEERVRQEAAVVHESGAADIKVYGESKYPRGYDELFAWFECVAAKKHPRLYDLSCKEEWSKLFKFLVCDDFYFKSKGKPVGTPVLEIILPEEGPKFGYDKLVAWFNCMRIKCLSLGDYRGYGRGHPASLIPSILSQRGCEHE